MSVMSETTAVVPNLAGELGEVLRDYMNVAQRLQNTHELLQREVARLRAELASKDRELERRRRLAALGELAAGVAHEVRNPLGAIQLYAGLLRHVVEQEDVQAALELIGKIDNGVQAIDGVVCDTLALAPRDGRLSSCGLAAILERATEVCQGVLEREGVVLTTECPDHELEVPGHPSGLQRVLVNLISNAAEASAPGSAVVVNVSRCGDEFVEIRVSDQGPGLPDEVRERLFEPFFTTKDNGTGLGLTIAHRLIEAHGGQLSAHNRAEGGAEFVIVLPAAPVGDGTRVTDASGQQTNAA
ncbi:MAG: sensor histidine kinase [Phycisphaerae bacterium]|nr:sensor histidine kinase [Phycisphaerae bacterium]